MGTITEIKDREARPGEGVVVTSDYFAALRHQSARRASVRSRHDQSKYVPFQTMSRCLSCRGKGAAADNDNDFDPMKFPAANAAFTPDGERIRPYTSSLPMQVRASPFPHPQMEIDEDPYAAPPPLPHVVSLPPSDYSASVRNGLLSDSEQPLGLGYRPTPTPGLGPENRLPPPPALWESIAGQIISTPYTE
ncbi:hypothetical protein B0H13DRAFT_2342081 [Mycena leptocephala]|nr:hypothetical protein B0H13DRAFT_2342081 [Mycena leptocephala]